MMTSTSQLGTLGLVACFKDIMIGTTNSVILYQLKGIYSICRYCWNVATYKGKFTIGRLKSSVLS